MLEKRSIETNEEKSEIEKIYENARKSGFVVMEKIPNPKESELAYYEDIIGMKFQHSPKFFKEALAKWLPALKSEIGARLADAIYDALEKLRISGKNENMLKNAYIKFMCWLYYRFRGELLLLENKKEVTVICIDSLSEYENAMVEILSNIGCRVLLFSTDDMARLESGFENRQKEADEKTKLEALCGGEVQIAVHTNDWLKGDVFSQIKLSQKGRGANADCCYNVFCRISGVDDKDTYEKSLFEFYEELKKSGRTVVIVNGGLEPPSNDEIAKIKRKGVYGDSTEMLKELVQNLNFSNKKLNVLMRRAYIILFEEQAKRTDITLSKLQSKMVYLICWFKRYEKEIFGKFDFSKLPVFIKTGASKTETETLFIRYLAMLPVDVQVLKPNLQEADLLESTELYDLKFEQSMEIFEFPLEINHTTAAYNAERNLSEILYQGSGLYRDRQYKKADSVVLRTMMEEIELLWGEEPRFRQGFSEDGDAVNIPTVFAKLSGVPNANITEYWRRFGKLVIEDSVVVKRLPYIDPLSENPMKPFVIQFYKNGKLNKKAIKAHPKYKYGMLREETQEHILDKLGELIEKRMIAGIGENGTEYTAIAVVLNLPKEVIRLIQKFDFTKKNPKFIYINTGEKIVNLEDSILSMFLNLVGFDVLFMVPTGYQSVEKYFAKDVLVEHQIGEYLYDIAVPENFGEKILYQEKKSWRDFFGLGGK